MNHEANQHESLGRLMSTPNKAFQCFVTNVLDAVSFFLLFRQFFLLPFCWITFETFGCNDGLEYVEKMSLERGSTCLLNFVGRDTKKLIKRSSHAGCATGVKLPLLWLDSKAGWLAAAASWYATLISRGNSPWE